MNDLTVQATKRCSKCGETKAATLEFWGPRKKWSRDGLDSWCRACNRAASTARNRRRGLVPHVPIEERMRERVARGEPDECWPFTGTRDKLGYGHISCDGRPELAHRVAKALSLGIRVRELGQCVLHHCDNPPCCNPAHLFLGTQGDNMADKTRKGRAGAPRGERHAFSRLREDDIRAIRAARAAGVTRRTLAEQYDVDYTCILRIEMRESWRHVR